MLMVIIKSCGHSDDRASKFCYLLSEKAEEIVERVGHDAALANFQINQWVIVDVVEAHLVRYRKTTLHQHTDA